MLSTENILQAIKDDNLSWIKEHFVELTEILAVPRASISVENSNSQVSKLLTDWLKSNSLDVQSLKSQDFPTIYSLLLHLSKMYTYALDTSIIYSRLEIFNALLAIKPLAAVESFRAPMLLAIQHDRLEICQRLASDIKSYVNPVDTSRSQSTLDPVKDFFAPNQSVRHHTLRSILKDAVIIAAKCGRVEILRLLNSEFSGELDLTINNNYAIRKAAKEGYFQLLKFLVLESDQPVDIHAKEYEAWRFAHRLDDLKILNFLDAVSNLLEANITLQQIRSAPEVVDLITQKKVAAEDLAAFVESSVEDFSSYIKAFNKTQSLRVSRKL